MDVAAEGVLPDAAFIKVFNQKTCPRTASAQAWQKEGQTAGGQPNSLIVLAETSPR